MSTFALPVPSWRLGYQPKKRKRDADKHAEGSASPDPETASTASHLPPGSINPRSHSPKTLRQFALAGLSPEEEIPSQTHPGFPHKPLPQDWQSGGTRSRRSGSRTTSATSGSEGDVDTDGESRRQKEEEIPTNSSDRIKHMGTMVAILHRCIHEDDIPRAKRAFSLLIRTKDVDIRLNEMWTLGTEILMRDGEDKNRKDQPDVSQVPDNASEEGSPTGSTAARPRPPRWGSARNMEKVRDYLGTLAQHHPYDSHFPRSTSAVDFWPALYNIEIYNVDIECKLALHRLDESAALQEDDMMLDPPLSQDGSDDCDAQVQHHHDDRTAMQWAAKDEIRHTTQEAAQGIAERMDDLMQTVPYTTHVELLRLRGLLALYIGDLHLPSRLLDRSGVAGNKIGERLQRLSLAEHVYKSAQSQDERDAVRWREAEIEKARGFFERMVEKGGELDPWLLKFLDPDEDETSVLS